jgi:NAD(P)-dependent dehydrogenase (short-subunit alcohol dehydrogenase family)
MDISGKTVIVTGAGRGVGRALAIEFGRRGANVVCAARHKDQLAETVTAIEAEGGAGLAVATDVTDESRVQAMVDAALERFGSVDVLFNNAGSFACLGGIWEVDPDVWWQDVTVNLLGVMLCSRAVLPHMMERNSGVIFNMNGGNQIAGGTGYSCSKVAVMRLTELMAKEQTMEGTNVLVLGMGPGFVRTEMTEIQISTDVGRKWLPSSREAVEQGRDSPPEKCALTTMDILEHLCPQMNGCHFGAGMDVKAWIAEHCPET